MAKKGFCILIIALMATACLDEPDCYQLNNYIVGIAFKKLADSKADTVSFLSFGTVEPLQQFYGDTTLSRLFLPLNYFVDETTFYFETPDTVRLLRLGYLSQVQFVSEECGEKFVLSKLRVLEHSFDSVRLVLDTPTEEARVTQIEIFQ